MVSRLGLIVSFPKDSVLYRVRERMPGNKWEISAQSMGVAPFDKAEAGRMNPAGISYLYLAKERQTALAEVLKNPPSTAVVAEFRTTTDFLVLDLTNLPLLPSVFDEGQGHNRECLLFLQEFLKDISCPVSKDGHEHVDYVPSQVVTEYFAKEFSFNGSKILGIVYPSAALPGGSNIVLFPQRYKKEFSVVEFVMGTEADFVNWSDFFRALNYVRAGLSPSAGQTD